MARSRTWYPRIRALLPPDEPMAPLMARLFVLWQDLLFEEAGIIEDDGFPRMDRRGPHRVARTLYFLRGNARTLVNARDLFEAFGALDKFRTWLAEDALLESAYRTALKTFNRHRSDVEAVRNEIGGHVGEEVGESLQYFGSDDQTSLEVHAEDFMRPHVATDILFATLSKQGTPDKRLDAYRRSIEPLALATGAMIKAMSIVMDVYVRRLGLLEG